MKTGFPPSSTPEQRDQKDRHGDFQIAHTREGNRLSLRHTEGPACLAWRRECHPPSLPSTSTHTQDGALISIWPKRQIFADSCSSQPVHFPHNRPTSFCHKSPSEPLGKPQWIPESHSLGPSQEQCQAISPAPHPTPTHFQFLALAWSGTCYADQLGLRVEAVLQARPPERQDCRQEPPHLAELSENPTALLPLSLCLQ